MIMKLFSSLATAVLAATTALLSAGAQAGPMPTNVAAMKLMVDKNTTEVRWRGGGVGYRGGVAYRGGVGYRGGVAYRGGLGYRGLGYGVAAGAIVGGAVARRAYYGGYGGYSGDYSDDSYAAEQNYDSGGYPSYSYAAAPQYSYGGGSGYGGGVVGYSGGCTCQPYGGYVPVQRYGW